MGNGELYERIVRTSNEVYARTLATDHYVDIPREWLQDMTTHDEFWKAWKNYTATPDDPNERLKAVVKDRLDIDIMLTQAYEILKWGLPDRLGEELKAEVKELIDDELVGIFTRFVTTHKGAE